MSAVLWTLASIFAALCFYIYRKASEINKTFARKNIPHDKPSLFVGNAWRFVIRKEFQGVYFRRLCEKYPDEPIVGYYEFLRPILLIKDPLYIEKVLVKDFHHFVDRGFPIDETENPLDVNLFSLTGNRWRALRNKFSPLFTTGRLKVMFHQIVNVGGILGRAIEKENKKGLELKEILGRFSMDTIGSCAFGLEPTHIDQPDTEFIKRGKSIFTLTLSRFIRFLLVINLPKVAKLLGLSGLSDRPTQNFFCDIIRKTMNYRAENNIKRNDFIDLMMQLKEKGHVDIMTKDPNDDYLNIEEKYKTSSYEITDNILIGQAFVFLTAGFEATTVAINNVFYDLSINPEAQEKARQEVLRCIEKNGGVLDYESVKEMEYLDMCLKETLRLHSTLPQIGRVCTKKYTFPNGVTVEPGDMVGVPMMYVHMDPANYPEPEKYDPERFKPGASLNPCTYLPFGDGPRVCIAMRFALLQMRLCVAKLISEYRITLNENTKPLVFDPLNFFGGAKHPFLFDLEKI